MAQKKHSLNQALEMTLSDENWRMLWEYAGGLPETKVLKRSERLASADTSAAKLVLA